MVFILIYVCSLQCGQVACNLDMLLAIGYSNPNNKIEFKVLKT